MALAAIKQGRSPQWGITVGRIATSDQVSSGTLGGLEPTSVTCMLWCYDLAAFASLMGKNQAAGALAGFYVGYTASTGQIRVQWSRVTTALDYSANGAMIRGAWQFVAVRLDSGGSAGALCQIYTGDPNTPARECTNTTATDGSGTFGLVTSWNWRWGNRQNTNNASATFTLLSGAVCSNTLLSLGEIQDWQFNYNNLPRGCVVRHQFGANGLLSVVDDSLSGNHGTVAGSTLTLIDELAVPQRRRSFVYLPFTAAAVPAAMFSYRQRRA